MLKIWVFLVPRRGLLKKKTQRWTRKGQGWIRKTGEWILKRLLCLVHSNEISFDIIPHFSQYFLQTIMTSLLKI